MVIVLYACVLSTIRLRAPPKTTPTCYEITSGVLVMSIEHSFGFPGWCGWCENLPNHLPLCMKPCITCFINTNTLFTNLI